MNRNHKPGPEDEGRVDILDSLLLKHGEITLVRFESGSYCFESGSYCLAAKQGRDLEVGGAISLRELLDGAEANAA